MRRWLRADSFDVRLPDTRYRPDALWVYFLTLDPMQDLANYSQLDERAAQGVVRGFPTLRAYRSLLR